MKSFKQHLQEAMTPKEAQDVFKKYGHKANSTSYKTLIKKLHPDKGGKLEDAQELNSAWDTLNKFKSIKRTKPEKKAYSEYKASQKTKPTKTNYRNMPPEDHPFEREERAYRKEKAERNKK